MSSTIQLPSGGGAPSGPAKDGLSGKMTKLGFGVPSMDVINRLVVSLEAPEKMGKTHWALTAPDPIAVVATDTGSEEIVRKFLRAYPHRRIYVNNFAVPEKADKSEMAEYHKEWKRMRDVIEAIRDDRYFRTIIGDTGTEIWELCRLAAFGKLSQVLPQHYVAVNAEFREVIKMLYARPDLNVILTHKVKKQYVAGKEGKDVWNGKWERSGFGDLPYLVDVNLQLRFASKKTADEIAQLESRPSLSETQGVPDPKAPWQGIDRFCMELKDCRQNPDVVGEVFRGDMCSFPWLGMLVFPQSDPMYWEG